MNEFKHASTSIATLIEDNVHLEQFCYTSPYPNYSKNVPAYPRDLDLTQLQNNVKRLGIAIPELLLIRIKKGF